MAKILEETVMTTVSKKSKRLIDRFFHASIELQMLGYRGLASHEEIRKEYNEAREKLLIHINKLESIVRSNK